MSEQEERKDAAEVISVDNNVETSSVNEKLDPVTLASDAVKEDPPRPKSSDAGISDTSIIDTSTPGEKREEDVRVRNLRLMARSKEKLQQDYKMLENERNQALDKIKEYELRFKSEDADAGIDDADNVSDYDVDSKAIKDLKKQVTLQQEQQQQFLTYLAVQKAEEGLVKKHNDFAEVVSETNTSILKELDPTEYMKIVKESDIFKKGLMAYKAIRKHNIFQSANAGDNAGVDAAYNKEIITKNMTKPRPAAATVKSNADSASVFSNLHSRDFQNQLRKELEESRRKM